MFDISVIYDAGVVGLRMIMPLLAIVIVYQCYAAMRRRRRPEKPLVSLYNPKSGGMIPVVFWENSIGRSKSSDIVINDLSVSRNHCVLCVGRRLAVGHLCQRRAHPRQGAGVGGRYYRHRQHRISAAARRRLQFSAACQPVLFQGQRQACHSGVEADVYDHHVPPLYGGGGDVLERRHQRLCAHDSLCGAGGGGMGLLLGLVLCAPARQL